MLAGFLKCGHLTSPNRDAIAYGRRLTYGATTTALIAAAPSAHGLTPSERSERPAEGS